MTTTSKIHYSHFKRDHEEPPSFDIQERDIEILDAVHQNRFLTMSILALLFPPDPTARERKAPATAQPVRHRNLEQRVKKLFRSYHLQRLRQPFGGEYVYALEPRGAKLLLEKQPALPFLDVDWKKKNKDISSSHFPHTLMVARFRASLLVALREHPTITLYDFEREGVDLKKEWKRNNKRIYVNPDAFFTLKDTRTNRYIPCFLEVDRSTEKHSILQDKYRRYSLMHEDDIHKDSFGISNFSVLTVFNLREHADNALTLAAGEKSAIPKHLKHLFYFTPDTAYIDAPTNTLAAIFRRADDIEKLRAIVAAPLPRKTS